MWDESEEVQPGKDGVLHSAETETTVWWPRPEDYNEMALADWSLKIRNTSSSHGFRDESPRQCLWVSLEGKRVGWNDTLCTSPVQCTVFSTQIKVVSGKIYFLVGKINTKRMLEENFSPELIRAFETGFPQSWERMVIDELHKIEESLPKTS
ncbi:MAG: uncharacterized protein A8A55_0866 [Amphiamblys sp. WSBS2006]|nr:MAG: uncharacterized protein A8A55_0866 [Amphiamblys sp. WSBS2006]